MDVLVIDIAARIAEVVLEVVLRKSNVDNFRNGMLGNGSATARNAGGHSPDRCGETSPLPKQARRQAHRKVY